MFWKHYDAVFKKANNLAKEKSKDYVGNESIFDYWIHGEDDIIYEIHKKVLRMIRQKKFQAGTMSDGIEDSILDMMCLSAFLYSYIKVKEGKADG